MQRIPWLGQTLELLPQRALLWLDTQTLVLTDLHFGKAAAFRASGIPIPSGSTQADLLRMASLIEFHAPERLLLLGDFFHAAAGRTEEIHQALTLWRHHFQELDVVLVRGNHDAHAGDPPAEWNFHLVDEWAEGPFLFRHHPNPAPGQYVMAGHVHPAVKLRDRRGQTLRAPVFLFRPDLALLPAFGSFTGTASVTPQRGDRVFLLGPTEVLEIPVEGVRFGGAAG